MKYYRVKPEYDNYTKYVWRYNQGVSDGILIADELYTPTEYKKLANYHGYFEEVEISKKKIYWFFGARFAE